MVRNFMIRFKVSEEELRLIRIKMKNLNYSNRSQFFRDVALQDGLSTFEMLTSIYEKICLSKSGKKQDEILEGCR